MGCGNSKSEKIVEKRKDEGPAGSSPSNNDNKSSHPSPKSGTIVMLFDDDTLTEFNESHATNIEVQRKENADKDRLDRELFEREQEAARRREADQERDYLKFEQEREVEKQQLKDDIKTGKIQEDCMIMEDC